MTKKKTEQEKLAGVQARIAEHLSVEGDYDWMHLRELERRVYGLVGEEQHQRVLEALDALMADGRVEGDRSGPMSKRFYRWAGTAHDKAALLAQQWVAA